MKLFATALAALSALSLVPLVLLVRATRAFVPGKGPQGGEALFLFWVLFLGWVWVASFAALVSAGLLLAGEPLVRYVLLPGGALAGVTLWVGGAFFVLSRGLEPSSASGPGASAVLAGLIAAALLGGSQAILLRAVALRG